MTPKPKGPCSVDARDRLVRSLGLCGRRYMRQYRHGSPTGGGRDLTPQNATCKVAGCHSKSASHSLCAAHWYRLGRTGSVQADVPVKTRARANKEG
jgi:hypothetical protein